MINIAVFGYDFEHYKTSNIIKNTYKNKCNIKAILLSPKKIYNLDNIEVGIDHNSKNITTREFCSKKNINLYSVFHDDLKSIKEIIEENKINLAIIGGAKVIQKKIIDLFSKGVINYHPGKLPECKGLDSIYKSVREDLPPCVTAHYINEKIDQGFLIHEEFFKIDIDDTIENIKLKNEICQLKVNTLVLKKIQNNNTFLKIIKETKYLSKLSNEEKKYLLINSFKEWKKKYS